MTQLVKQRNGGDCGICCVAMALGVPYEYAWRLLAENGLRPDYATVGIFGSTIAKACGAAADLRGIRYAGSLERCIVQVALDPNRMAHHWIWIDGQIYDPAARIEQWGQIRGFGQVIHVEKHLDGL